MKLLNWTTILSGQINTLQIILINPITLQLALILLQMLVILGLIYTLFYNQKLKLKFSLVKAACYMEMSLTIFTLMFCCSIPFWFELRFK